jgi:glycosyltransferase involved in cell wall biosynthesis
MVPRPTASSHRGTPPIILNLFYEEPEGDRWLPFDRYPRRAVRRVLRGKPRIGGQQRVFLNLCAGLDRIGVPYRVNDHRWTRENPTDVACIIGKSHLLDAYEWCNPILFGTAVFSHPIDDRKLLERLPVRKILVPGRWMKEMWRPHWDETVAAWPVGIDTDRWRPAPAAEKPIDVLLYDKVRWEHDHYERVLIEPIRQLLRVAGRSFHEIRYGFYREEQFQAGLAECRAMIFLCEHETQGIAYQQALACSVPILAWDRGGYWRDPAYFPDRVKFAPVTSVPYWDERCGATFTGFDDFSDAWDRFWVDMGSGRFAPRDYILENLTLEEMAGRYVEHVASIAG